LINQDLQWKPDKIYISVAFMIQNDEYKMKKWTHEFKFKNDKDGDTDSNSFLAKNIYKKKKKMITKLQDYSTSYEDLKNYQIQHHDVKII